MVANHRNGEIDKEKSNQPHNKVLVDFGKNILPQQTNSYITFRIIKMNSKSLAKLNNIVREHVNHNVGGMFVDFSCCR